ncbi:MAG TPA: hypothetical protein V6C58_02330 [Allocoleopsis sp.]
MTSYQISDTDALIKIISKAYPFGQRENMPYQIWLDEVKLVKHFLTLKQPYYWYFNWVNQFKSYKNMVNVRQKQKNPNQVHVNPDQLTLF